MITSITLKGWKSFRSLSDFELRPLNIFIGQNGAGKSNLIHFFRMLSYVYAGEGLQFFSRLQGGANMLLYEGAEQTQQIEFELCFQTETGRNIYRARLVYAAADTLFFAEERVKYIKEGYPDNKWIDLGYAHEETHLKIKSAEGDKTSKSILWHLQQGKVYQFHNTAFNSRMRQKSSASENTYLREDGSNLTSMLYGLQTRSPIHYNRIVETLRLAYPQFNDFVFMKEPTEQGDESLLLRWRERGSDLVFNAAQVSDGTVRLMALLTILMQPRDRLPKVILLDEPELGLHPDAIRIVAEQLHSVATSSQIIIATQSAYLLNFFDPEDIVVVNRGDRETKLKRLSEGPLNEWLENYTLSQLWEKNVLGGKP